MTSTVALLINLKMQHPKSSIGIEQNLKERKKSYIKFRKNEKI